LPAHHHQHPPHQAATTHRAHTARTPRHDPPSIACAQALIALLASCDHAPPPQTPPPAAPVEQPAPPAPAPDTATPDAIAQARALLHTARATPLLLDPIDDAPCTAEPAAARREPDQRGVRFDATLEHVWLAPGSLVLHGLASGGWKKRGAALAPPAGQPAALHASPKDTPTADLMLRARLSTDRALDAWIATRAAFDADGQPTRGYTLRFDGTSAQLWRVDGPGDATPISPSEPVFQIHKRRAIEVIWWSLGDLHLAQIHDAGSGVELLSLMARDATYTRGLPGAGFPAAHANRPGAGLLSLSARDACAPAGAPSEDPPPRRFLSFTHAAWDALPAPTRDAMTLRERTATHVIAQSGAPTIEALHCAGTPPAAVSIEIPWKYIEDDHLRWRDLPPVRDAAGGLRVDLSTLDNAQLHAIHAATQRLRPDLVHISVIGHSTRGLPIHAVRIGRGQSPDRPAVLLLGAHHGNEVTATSIVVDALQQIIQRAGHDPRVDRWLDQLDIWLVPLVNPDGADDFINLSWRTGRKNGRITSDNPLHALRQGVDLNRNYPLGWGVHEETRTTSGLPTSAYYRGPEPASEPETQAVMALVNLIRPAAALTYHTGTVSVLVPYTVSGYQNPTPNEAEALAQLLASASPPHPERLEWRVRKNLYAVDGTDQDWMRHAHGTVALLIEAARRTPRTRCDRASQIAANRPAWEALLDRMTAGPLLIARVTDAQGAPIPDAAITLSTQTLRANERWTTRADGQLVRLLDAPGPLTVRITTPDGLTTEHPIHIAADQPTQLTLRHAQAP
jgi:hypothetical protein